MLMRKIIIRRKTIISENYSPPKQSFYFRTYTRTNARSADNFLRPDVEFFEKGKEVDDFDTHTHEKKTMEKTAYYNFGHCAPAILKAAEIFVRIKPVFVSRRSFFVFLCVRVCRYLFFPIFFSRAKIFNNAGRFEIFIRNWHRMWFRLIIRYYTFFRS